jgi:hypothetical protein
VAQVGESPGREIATEQPRTGRTAAEHLPTRRARLARPRELWGRRTIALGVLLICAAIVGGVLLLVVGGADDGESRSVSPQVEKLQDELLDKAVVDPEVGISVRRPDSWTDAHGRGVITLRSRSRCVSMTLAAPAEARDAKKLIGDSMSTLRATYRAGQFHRRASSSVGGIPTSSFTASLRNERGKEVRVLLSVGTGAKYAYVTDIVLGNPRCRQDLATAQVILTSIKYTK